MCCRCLALGLRQRWPTEPHHEPPIGRNKGERDRAELDRDTVPLCTECHTIRHAMPVVEFWHEARVDYEIVRARMREGAVWDLFEHVPA
jgi:hypothetical protein